MFLFAVTSPALVLLYSHSLRRRRPLYARCAACIVYLYCTDFDIIDMIELLNSAAAYYTGGQRSPGAGSPLPAPGPAPRVKVFDFTTLLITLYELCSSRFHMLHFRLSVIHAAFSFGISYLSTCA